MVLAAVLVVGLMVVRARGFGSSAGRAAPIQAPPSGPTVAAASPATEAAAATPGATRVASRSGPAVTIVAPPATPTLAVRRRANTPVWQAAALARPPRLDGALDDWRGQPLDIASVVFGAESWSSPTDLSASAFAGWDAAALYLGVRVFDDVLAEPAQAVGAELHLGDSLELQLDADLEGDWDSPSYSADDWQIGLSPGDFSARGPEVVVWRPEGRPAAGVGVGARRLADGYILEAAIPWASLGVDPARVGAIGLALNVSDNDLPEPAQLTMISSSPPRLWDDPRTFGTLVLAAPGASSATPPR
jgi:hypothetical protein